MTARLRTLRTGRRLVVHDDSGNAMVEFVYLAVLLMVPLVYVLLTVFRVQGASFAASSAAREAGRVFATSDDVDAAGPRAMAAARIVMRDSNLDLDRRDVRISCSSNPCLAPGSTVDVEVAHDVSLPLLPQLFDGRAPATVRVTSRHLEVVDRFRDGAG